MTSLTNRWKRSTIVVLLIGVSLLHQNNVLAEHQLFSEGGSFAVVPEDKTSNAPISQQPSDNFVEDNNDLDQLNEPYLQNYFPASVEQQLSKFEEERKRQRLANIVAQLRENSRQLNAQEGIYGDGEAGQMGDDMLREGNNRNAGIDWDALKELSGELETPGTIVQQSTKQIETVKKGQNEFVEFVEPRPSNRLNKPEWMEEKRAEGIPRTNSFKLFSNSGNLLFMVYLAVCCAGIVAGTFGGIYYYNHVRANRVDDPFNEFTRYSPAGPGKEKLKRAGGGGSPTFGGQSGDDTLAYKAQLQHYQQQKQKILGSASSPVHENISDAEEDTDEMDHNYSVFECPGLAPTGDLEIQNPNFTGGEKSDQH